MAKFNSTTFGTISGRHGSAVATTTKDGQSILRVYKAPSNPRTEGQVSQRSKFALVNSELRYMSKLFKITFGSSKGLQKACSLALKNAVVGESPNYSIDYSKLIIAQGAVQPAEQAVANVSQGITVGIEWDDTVGYQASEHDNVNLVFLNDVSKVGVIFQNQAQRMNGSIEVDLPDVWVGAAIHCWLYFSTPQGDTTSTSQYLALLQL